MDLKMNKNTQSPTKWANLAFGMIIISLIIIILIYFKTLLIPVVLAIIVTFLIQELALLIGRIKIGGKALPRWLRNTTALMLVTGVIIACGEMISYNVDQIIEKAPVYGSDIKNLMESFNSFVSIENFNQRLTEWISTIDLETYISHVLNSFSSFLGNAFLILMYSIFFLLEGKFISEKINIIFNKPERRKQVGNILDDMSNAIRQYVAVKTAASLLTGVLTYLVLVLFKVDFPILWAFLAFLLNFIPFIGSFLAVLLPSLLAIVQFGSFLTGLWVAIGLLLVQSFVANVIEPRYTGKSLNLSPVVILLALSFWGGIWGITGMAIAVPVTSLLVIVFAEFPDTRIAAIILSEKGNV